MQKVLQVGSQQVEPRETVPLQAGRACLEVARSQTKWQARPGGPGLCYPGGCDLERVRAPMSWRPHPQQAIGAFEE